MGDRLAGKLALVTGAGSGIGQAVAIRFAEEGAQVIVASRTGAHVRETTDRIRDTTGVTPFGVSMDVTDEPSIRHAVSTIVDRFGVIDILSNNAGVDDPSEPSVADMTDEIWDRTLSVNVTGVFRVCRAVIPVMADGGSIVNMGSRDSLVARPNAAAYCASKAAVLQLTRTMALELAPRRIRANCVCPGIVDTPLVDLFLTRADDPIALRAAYASSNAFGRFAEPREIANCVLFLASDESTFVTGSPLVVDGGALSW